MSRRDEPKTPTGREREERPEGVDELSPEDRILWERIVETFSQCEHPLTSVSDEFLATIERVIPAVEVDEALAGRIEDVIQRAFLDNDFDAEMKRLSRRPTLGGYLFFLRSRAGWSSTDAADEASIDSYLVQQLEGNQLSPLRIPAPSLAHLVRKLKGSLGQLELLLPTAIQQPQYVYAGDRRSLYRSAPGATRHTSEAASLAGRKATGQQTENPEYTREREAVRQLILEMRAAWNDPTESTDE